MTHFVFWHAFDAKNDSLRCLTCSWHKKRHTLFLWHTPDAQNDTLCSLTYSWHKKWHRLFFQWINWLGFNLPESYEFNLFIIIHIGNYTKLCCIIRFSIPHTSEKYTLCENTSSRQWDMHHLCLMEHWDSTR